MSRAYALADAAEAADYLRDPTLRARLLSITDAVRDQILTRRVPLPRLLGSDVDARKLVSSLTLFEHVAQTLHRDDGLDDYGAIARAARDVLTAAAREGYARCAYTLGRLAGEPIMTARSAPPPSRTTARVLVSSSNARCRRSVKSANSASMKKN